MRFQSDNAVFKFLQRTAGERRKGFTGNQAQVCRFHVKHCHMFPNSNICKLLVMGDKLMNSNL